MAPDLLSFEKIEYQRQKKTWQNTETNSSADPKKQAEGVEYSDLKTVHYEAQRKLQNCMAKAENDPQKNQNLWGKGKEERKINY